MIKGLVYTCQFCHRRKWHFLKKNMRLIFCKKICEKSCCHMSTQCKIIYHKCKKALSKWNCHYSHQNLPKASKRTSRSSRRQIDNLHTFPIQHTNSSHQLTQKSQKIAKFCSRQILYHIILYPHERKTKKFWRNTWKKIFSSCASNYL